MSEISGEITKISREITKETPEKCRFRQPHCHSAALSRNPANIRINLTLSETTVESFNYIFFVRLSILFVADSENYASILKLSPFKVIQCRLF